MDGYGKLVEWIVLIIHAWMNGQMGGWMEGWRLFFLFILIDWAQYIFTFITVSSS